MRSLEQLQIIGRDRLRFSPTALWWSSLAIEAGERLRRPRGSVATARSLERLAAAARAGHGRRNIAGIEQCARRRLRQWNPKGFPWEDFFPGSQPTFLRKAIILKRPISSAEKGVLYVAFETHWMRLMRHARLEALAADYDLVLSPTWSPPQDLALYIVAQLWPTDLYTLLSHYDDAEAMERVAPRIRVVPRLASHWVHPDLVAGPPPAKQYDVVMLANFAVYKRHFALFRALARMPRPIRVVLLGMPAEGRRRETVEHEAEIFGVRDQIEIRQNLPDEEMFQTLRSAKVSLILSRVEGSCVAVAESIFADVPVGLLQGARVGSSAFIHPQTGRFLREESLAADLADFISHSGEYQPRAWALEHDIDCHASSAILNEHLRRAAHAAGREWTVDIAPLHWRPNACYVRPQDADGLRDEYERFPGAYGVRIDL